MKKTHERKERYYYKAKNVSGLMSLKSPLPESELKDYEEITAAQFAALQPKPHTPTAAELAIREKKSRIAFLKGELARTDYQAIKFAEGWITAEEYASIKAERQAYRDEINELESEL